MKRMFLWAVIIIAAVLAFHFIVAGAKKAGKGISGGISSITKGDPVGKAIKKDEEIEKLRRADPEKNKSEIEKKENELKDDLSGLSLKEWAEYQAKKLPGAGKKAAEGINKWAATETQRADPPPTGIDGIDNFVDSWAKKNAAPEESTVSDAVFPPSSPLDQMKAWAWDAARLQYIADDGTIVPASIPKKPADDDGTAESGKRGVPGWIWWVGGVVFLLIVAFVLYFGWWKPRHP